MTPQQILDLKQKIRELDAAAANGPWKVDHVGNIRTQRGAVMPQTFRDADFIAFARTALPTLLAYCEELEGKVNDRDAVHDELCDVNDRNPDGIRKPCNCHVSLPIRVLTEVKALCSNESMSVSDRLWHIRELLATLRLSAERETEPDSKAPINRDINDMELIDDLKRIIAECEKEREIYRLALGYQSKGDFESADKILATLKP